MLASQLSIYKDTYQLVKTVTVYINKMPSKTLVMTESNGVMISEWVDNNNINNKNH